MYFIFGYNAADSHPIVARRIVKAKRRVHKLLSVTRAILNQRVLLTFIWH